MKKVKVDFEYNLYEVGDVVTVKRKLDGNMYKLLIILASIREKEPHHNQYKCVVFKESTKEYTNTEWFAFDESLEVLKISKFIK